MNSEPNPTFKVQAPLRSLAGFVPGSPWYKYSDGLVNNQLDVCLLPAGFLCVSLNLTFIGITCLFDSDANVICDLEFRVDIC